MKIVFMGTPEFAVASLAKLLASEHEIVGVITAPDRKAGRGQKIKYSAVKEFALEHDLLILQPTNLKNLDFQQELQSLNADIQVVVAFRMLPEAVWNMPPMGSVNVHGSLLPQYRGAAPINWAIMNGEIETGVTTFFLKHEIDTGKIIFQDKIAIGENENVGEIYEKLMNLGADLIVKTMNAVAKGDYPQIDQDHVQDIKHAPKLYKETCQIDWSKSAQEIHNHIRGLSPYPSAWTMLGEKSVKLYESVITEEYSHLKAGEIFTTKKQLFVGTINGALEIKNLQLQGKKRMKTTDFLSGFQGEMKSFG